jgi:ubiquinone/menaquinone biosynthesis C-methylase UbiE
MTDRVPKSTVDYREIYNRQAAEYDLLVTREDYQGNILPHLEAIRPLTGLRVVELGAGTGRLTRLIGPHVYTLLALDRSLHMLAFAHESLGDLDSRDWLAVAADNRRLPLADGQADLVVAGWSLGHLVGWHERSWREEIMLVLSEMKRMLRPGGTIVILETLGTGQETPRPPTEGLAAYYAFLEDEYGFSASWIRTDYRFESLEEAERLVGFFFGPDLATRVAREKLQLLPECTGIWWRTIST